MKYSDVKQQEMIMLYWKTGRFMTEYRLMLISIVWIKWNRPNVWNVTVLLSSYVVNPQIYIPSTQHAVFGGGEKKKKVHTAKNTKADYDPGQEGAGSAEVHGALWLAAGVSGSVSHQLTGADIYLRLWPSDLRYLSNSVYFFSGR